MNKRPVFLAARWEYLIMMNYSVEPELLIPHLPPYTELDLFEGKALVSVVGFLFNNTRVLGVPWPMHTRFEEVNLRFYVRHFDGKEWKRGVAFISEIVPRAIISIMANRLYNEHYSTAQMKHTIDVTDREIAVAFYWKKRKAEWNSIEVLAENQPGPLLPGSEAHFILEHYWGYNMLNPTTTIEYAVEHASWEIFPVKHFKLVADVEGLYGKSFAPFIQNKSPQSVFLALGSDVVVRKPTRIVRSMIA
ncbi:MAG: DUF2071 domain-containing protein [Chitinophagaceae bacterium]|nr:MAG: DUF2071 domain-containing protein [Chitinophagaceae bacterium]